MGETKTSIVGDTTKDKLDEKGIRTRKTAEKSENR
jgi:hypothetical protein